MDSLQVFDYNGKEISRNGNGFINLTEMCAANGKRLDVFLKAAKTQEYIAALENYHQTVVVCSSQGKHGGTWGHPSLAINLARWISSEFAVWCDRVIFTVIRNGAIASPRQPTTLEILESAVAAEKARLLAEAENKLLMEENRHLSEALDELFDYSAITRIAKFNGVSEKNYDWRKLKVMSEKLCREIKKVPCPRFVEKNLYHHDVWRACYPDAKLPETTTLVIKNQ